MQLMGVNINTVVEDTVAIRCDGCLEVIQGTPWRVNILDIDYHRDGAIELGVNDVRVLISVETRDFEHGQRVIELISAAGYPAERL